MIKLSDLSIVELERLSRNIKMRMFHYSIFDSQYTNLCRQADAVKNEISERYRIYSEEAIEDDRELLRFEEDMKIIERRYTPYETRKAIKDVIQNKKEGRKMNNLYVPESNQKIKLENFKAEMKKRTQEEKDEMFKKFEATVTPIGKASMIISPGFEFERGFIPQEGLKMYLQCPTCKQLHDVVIGQGEIVNPKNDKLNTCCIDNLEDCYSGDIFKPTPVQYVYSDSKYCLHDNYDSELNTDLFTSLGKVIGEVSLEHWDLNDDTLIDLKRYVEFDTDYKYIVNKEDTMALIHLSYYNIPLDRFYMIDNDLNIVKIDSIEMDLKINIK